MGQSACGKCWSGEDEKDTGTAEEQSALCKGHDGLVLPPQQVVQVNTQTRCLAPHSQFADPPSPHHPDAPKLVEHVGGSSGSATHCGITGTQCLTGSPGNLPAPHDPDSPALVENVGGSSGNAEHGSTTQVQCLTDLPGNRKSLLIGINYHGTASQLSGCINDIRRVQPVLCKKWGFPDDSGHQRVLLDDPQLPQTEWPTLSNIRNAISWLVQGANTGDALYLHYSGHGGREPRSDGNGYHETLCPLDYEIAGMLVDVDIFETLVRPLPSGCRLTCVLDCCHSAGALDLPYVFTGSKENLDKALAGEAMNMAMGKNWMRDLESWRMGNSQALLGDLSSMGLGLWEMYQKRQESKNAAGAGFAGSEAAANAGLAVGEVIAFTGCRSDQTSADVGNIHEQFHISQQEASGGASRLNDHAGGALTAVFLETMQDPSAESISYLQLLERMRLRLQEEGFSQVPQLASSLLVELKQRFSLCTAFLPPDPSTLQRGCGKGFDAVDGAIIAGGAACAAGFLASLVQAPHGSTMLQHASREAGGTPYGYSLFDGFSGFNGEHPWANPGSMQHLNEPLIGWGEEQHVGIEKPLIGWGEEQHVGIEKPLIGWGEEQHVGTERSPGTGSESMFVSSEGIAPWGCEQREGAGQSGGVNGGSDTMLQSQALHTWGSEQNYSQCSSMPTRGVGMNNDSGSGLPGQQQVLDQPSGLQEWGRGIQEDSASDESDDQQEDSESDESDGASDNGDNDDFFDDYDDEL